MEGRMYPDSEHYVAHLKVEKVVRRVTTDRANQGTTSRDVVETVNLTVKAQSLTGLKEKISAHVSLLDEEDL